jgi:hypothetical protein
VGDEALGAPLREERAGGRGGGQAAARVGVERVKALPFLLKERRGNAGLCLFLGELRVDVEQVVEKALLRFLESVELRFGQVSEIDMGDRLSIFDQLIECLIDGLVKFFADHTLASFFPL